MKHRKEKKHLKKCFDVRLDAYLSTPDDAIVDYVQCARCAAYIWLDVPDLRVTA